jgi:predicted PurR-regulated permease PerM
MPVPPLLVDAAGWSWRLLVVAGLAYGLVWLLGRLSLLVLAFIAALLLTALMSPIASWLRGRGLHRALAALLTVLLGFLVLGVAGYVVITRAAAGYSGLVVQLKHVSHHLEAFAIRDLHVPKASVHDLERTVLNVLNRHRTVVIAGVVKGVGIAGEVLAGVVLTIFIGIFCLYDGALIWAWVVRLFPVAARPRATAAGARAWERLSGYVRGAFLIAVFHAIVIAVALFALGVPLVAPLAVLVFLGAFIPLVGALVAGVLAVAVAFVAKGTVAGVVLIAVLLIDSQVEAHVLQPFLVGRYVRLHPLAVAVCISGGGLLAGIPGAILAVPIVAVSYAVISQLLETRTAT